MENNYNNVNSGVSEVINHSEKTQQPAAQYVQPAPDQQFTPPARQLRTNRSMILTVILTVITLGIYGLVTCTQFSDEINVTAQKYDGKKTMNYCLLFFLVGPLTLGIGYIVWYHKFSKRVGNELKRRGINFGFGAGSFWIWNTIGLLIIVGPFIYLYKLCKAMNLINADYNQKG